MRTEDNVAAGMTREQARREALIRFGSPTATSMRRLVDSTLFVFTFVGSVCICICICICFSSLVVWIHLGLLYALGVSRCGLGACWGPMGMNWGCYLKHGL
jgi:hypothetical protein